MPSFVNSPRRGFSLIESAIVLGIIGLIIGGIWVAAATVSNRNKINDVLTLVALAHEKALTFQKNLTITAANLAPIMALGPVPGNYVLNSGVFLTDGKLWFYPTLSLSSGNPLLTAYLTLNGSGFISPSAQTRVDLCLALSNRLLDVKLGVPVAVGHSISWYTSSLSNIANWDYGSARPSSSTLSTYCATTANLYFFWYL